MANEHLISKWRLLFKALDVRHAGRISKEDIKQEEQTFAELHNLDAERKKEMEEDMDELMKELLFRGRPGPITEQEFIDMNNSEYKADKENFVEKMQKCLAADFANMDVSGKGSLTEDEFIKAFRALGHENITLDKKFFESYHPVNGEVPLELLISSWVEFATSEDSSKQDMVKEALESGL
ncbi:sarcoplasmic calcium-binding protein-like [Mercenaria mercenaria]|uniref:sarcoplasmic calcium-binding protein-like n=1 Tax=Mercenaria mercenaria TaxID=6596 RepID=UPI00234F7061|nr:sarcoplasmic calcium-binding protein-like [Mercenaria mercenaria]